MKQMTLIEMDGFLKGKCIPGDLKVNETNAEYLVRKFGELESKLETALRECRSAGITIDNLEAKCASLAVENERLKVAKIRADFDDFDGDRRGIGDCLDEAEQELIVTINKYASQLAAEPIATNGVREQTAVPPVPVIQADVAQAIEKLKRKLVECNRYNYCADAVKGVEYACQAAMLQGAEPVSRPYTLPPLSYLEIVKFNADCAIQDPESIYANEFFLSLDEVFGERGNYSEPVQAKAVSILIGEVFRLRGYWRAAAQQEQEQSRIEMLRKVLKNAPLSTSDSQVRKKSDVDNDNQQFESLSRVNK